MRTFRLLFWLRWTLSWNGAGARKRWATIALTTLFVLAFSPFYVGGAIGAYVAGKRFGPEAFQRENPQ